MIFELLLAIFLGLLVGGIAAFAAGRRGPNDRIVVGVMGVRSRGKFLSQVFSRIPDTEVAYIADVDLEMIDPAVAAVKENQDRAPEGIQDFRRMLDDPAVDAIVMATPDHWHAPATVMALDAGKHVYVEKPCGHNPAEGEMLIAAQRKHNLVVQMGNQQRSSKLSIQAIKDIHDGLIGRPYLGRSWYSNTRGPIGNGKVVPVPEGLDYDLWQGPAPRTPYRDNIIHYNWHWFWRWGTGESCNNATHEVDICRWALQADYPIRVVSSGGRYHYDDDWEFWDTQTIGWDFPGEKTITWEGRSCNGYDLENRGRGASIHGTEGTVVIDRNGYAVYDLGGGTFDITILRLEDAGQGLLLEEVGLRSMNEGLYSTVAFAADVAMRPDAAAPPIQGDVLQIYINGDYKPRFSADRVRFAPLQPAEFLLITDDLTIDGP